MTELFVYGIAAAMFACSLVMLVPSRIYHTNISQP